MTAGQNCVPAFARSSASASGIDRAARYGRSLTSAVNPALIGTVTLSTASLSPSGSATLSVQIGRRAIPGTYRITVTGVSGSLTHTAVATLVVQ